MFDAALPTKLQRSHGRAAVRLRSDAGEGAAAGARLEGLAQSGCGKAFLPRVHGRAPEIVFLNTAGGLTGGDTLVYRLELGAGGVATGTTQTAERAYASSGGSAGVTVALEAGEGARLDWLPQETILFDGSALERETEIRMAGNARVLLCETIVLGRTAMGERVGRLAFRDTRRVIRDGRLDWLEPLRLDDATLAAPGLAAPGAARAMATVALFAPGAEDALAALRALPEPAGVRMGSSAWNGRCILRLLACEAPPLRRALAAALGVLRGGPLPRVWQI